MSDLVRGEANSTTNPRVLFAWQSPNVGDSLETGVPPAKRQLKGGFFQPLADPLIFRVLRPDNTELIAATNVDPTDPANQLDPVDGGPASSGEGRIIVPPFTIPTTEPTGTYTLEVTFIADPEDTAPLPAQTVSFPFRVLDEGLGCVDAYAQLVDLLDAGFPIGNPAPCGGFSLSDASNALLRASRYIEQITSRFFDARYRVFDLNGKGGPAIQTEHSIIGLTNVAFTFTTFTPADLPIQEGDLRVYNRHIRQGLLEPDDRNDPRVEFLRTPVYRFPRSQILGEVDILSSYIGFTDSQQNVKMKGMWGYTDPDGSPFGTTPRLIREVTMRLAARYIQPLWQQLGGAGERAAIGGPLVSERTLDQSATFANLAGTKIGLGAYAGAFTGDPEIDQILAMYMAPPKFRSA